MTLPLKQDAYQKVCDSCILIGGRAFEKGTWGGRAVPAVDIDGGTGEHLDLRFEICRLQVSDKQPQRLLGTTSEGWRSYQKLQES